MEVHLIHRSFVLKSLVAGDFFERQYFVEIANHCYFYIAYLLNVVLFRYKLNIINVFQEMPGLKN